MDAHGKTLYASLQCHCRLDNDQCQCRPGRKGPNAIDCSIYTLLHLTILLSLILTTTWLCDYIYNRSFGFVCGYVTIQFRAYHTPSNFQILRFSTSDINFLLENRNNKRFSSLTFVRKTSSWWSNLRLKFIKRKKTTIYQVFKI